MIIRLGKLSSSVLTGIILPLRLLRSTPSGYHGILSVHVLNGLIQHVSHRLQVVLVNGKKEFSRLELVGECSDQDFVIGFVNQKGLLVEMSHI